MKIILLITLVLFASTVDAGPRTKIRKLEAQVEILKAELAELSTRFNYLESTVVSRNSSEIDQLWYSLGSSNENDYAAIEQLRSDIQGVQSDVDYNADVINDALLRTYDVRETKTHIVKPGARTLLKSTCSEGILRHSGYFALTSDIEVWQILPYFNNPNELPEDNPGYNTAIPDGMNLVVKNSGTTDHKVTVYLYCNRQ